MVYRQTNEDSDRGRVKDRGGKEKKAKRYHNPNRAFERAICFNLAQIHSNKSQTDGIKAGIREPAPGFHDSKSVCYLSQGEQVLQTLQLLTCHCPLWGPSRQ